MDTTKIITVTIIGIIAIAVSLTLIQIFLQRLKKKSELEGKINIAFAICFISWIVAYSLINFKAFLVINEFVDTIYNLKPENVGVDIIKTSVLIIGLTNLWGVLCYYISKTFSLIFLGKRKDLNEVEINHYSYFIIKGSIYISFIYCLMPVFEILLRWFIPSIEIPFYR